MGNQKTEAIQSILHITKTMEHKKKANIYCVSLEGRSKGQTMSWLPLNCKDKEEPREDYRELMLQYALWETCTKYIILKFFLAV